MPRPRPRPGAEARCPRPSGRAPLEATWAGRFPAPPGNQWNLPGARRLRVAGPPPPRNPRSRRGLASSPLPAGALEGGAAIIQVAGRRAGGREAARASGGAAAARRERRTEPGIQVSGRYAGPVLGMAGGSAQAAGRHRAA